MAAPAELELPHRPACHPVPVTTVPHLTPLLDRVMYTYTDADRHLGLHSGTSRRWLNGYCRSNRLYEPVLREEPTPDDAVTWG